MVEYLIINKKLDPQAKNNEGQSAIDYAYFCREDDIRRWLISATSQPKNAVSPVRQSLFFSKLSSFTTSDMKRIKKLEKYGFRDYHFNNWKPLSNFEDFTETHYNILRFLAKEQGMDAADAIEKINQLTKQQCQQISDGEPIPDVLSVSPKMT